MERIEASVNGVTYERVSKAVARRLYNGGGCFVGIIGSKERKIYLNFRERDFSDCTDTFDTWVNAWCCYNQRDYGYPQFFIYKV